MNDITRILQAMEQDQAAEKLLPLVYNELRRLAAARLTCEQPGQTLQATALVHEAYLRLVGASAPPKWVGRGHFFAAAAEAMRRILVEGARRKKRLVHGGEFRRTSLDDVEPAVDERAREILDVDAALGDLADSEPEAAQVVKLHFFAGLTLDETANALGISIRTAYRDWAFARAWLARRLAGPDG